MKHAGDPLFDNGEPIFCVFERDPHFTGEMQKVMTQGWRDRAKFWDQYGFDVISPCGRDRFASFIFGKPWKGLLISISVVLFAAFVPVIIAIFAGNFVKPKPDLDLDAMHDLGYWNFILSSLILMVALSVYFTELSRVLFELCTRKVFRVNKDQYNEFVRMGNQTYSGLLITFIPWIIAFTVCIISLFVYQAGKTNTWHSFKTTAGAAFAGWASIPFIFTANYILTSAVLRIVASFLVLSRFFKFDASIQPLHPDGCGGLYPLGRLSMRLNTIVFGFGVICALGIFVNTTDYGLKIYHPMNILLMISYIIGSVVVFFLPLYSAHSSMQEARTRTIEAINNRFQRLNEEIVADMRQNKRPAMEKIQEIEEIPFNTKIVTSFVGSMGLPILLFIIQKLVEKVLV
jgi:hypothetical protein